jgi:small subunit ribosomal protein S16
MTMSVCIRLSRFGRLHRPLFRVVAIDKRCHREGMSNEIIGAYDPLKKDKNLELDTAKVESWVNRGAQISNGVRSLMKKFGYAVPAPTKTAAAVAVASKTAAPKAKVATQTAAKTPKKTYVAPTRRSLRQHAAKLKTERKAVAAATAASAAAAAPAAAPVQG